MMFPDDDVGILYVGPCSHTEGKRSLQDCHSPRSESVLIQIQAKCIINDVALRHQTHFQL